MKRTVLLVLILTSFFNRFSLSAQIQTGVFRTPAGNTDYHHFTRNNAGGAVVFINQESTAGQILRLSSGIATANQNVKFSFESNGNFGIGTTTIAEMLALYKADTLQVFTQYGNTKTNTGANRAFVVGIANNGNAMVWHREGLPLSFGTSNKERMRINADGSIDLFGMIRSANGSYQIDTTGIFYSKGYGTRADNVNYHQFTANNIYSAVFINQTGTTGPILRLSSGTAAANANVKFSFENNGSLGIGTINIAERAVLFNTDTAQTFLQYGNSKIPVGVNRGFVTGIASNGTGMIWHREAAFPISFGTANKERMRINADGSIDLFGMIRSANGSYQIDTTGIFYSKGYGTRADNVNYHQFTANNIYSAVFINQTGTTGQILRLSSGTAAANANVKFSFENNGNLGLGTVAPPEKLSLYTAEKTRIATWYGNGNGGGTTGLTVGVESDGSASLWLNTTAKPITFGTSNVERMRINANGNIGIGTASPDYKLDVVGNVRAHSVQISTAKTADFVFDEDYRLRPLSEVAGFIAANKHLPEIAPAAEMKEKGLDMGDMQIKLLQKVEELTLYVIQQQKEIEELKSLLKEKK